MYPESGSSPRVTVVSPHLDDTILSIGGTIDSLVRGGATVTIVTLFAGDPNSTTRASYWDAERGATQGEVVRQRRREDEAAANAVGARWARCRGRTADMPDSGTLIRSGNNSDRSSNRRSSSPYPAHR